MGRAANPERRAKLLDEVIQYILRHGLTELSLRPLGAAINTSPRMLLYFFGSKERLIAEALTQIRLRQQEEFARALIAPASRRERLTHAWELWSSPESEKSLWLFFEAYVLALRNRKRFPGFLEQLVKDWLPFFEQGFAAAGVPRERVQAMATFAYAAVRGLQLDLLATGERTRVDAAFRELLRMLSLQSSSVRPSGPGPNVNAKPWQGTRHSSMTKAAGVSMVGGRARPKKARSRRRGRRLGRSPS